MLLGVLPTKKTQLNHRAGKRSIIWPIIIKGKKPTACHIGLHTDAEIKVFLLISEDAYTAAGAIQRFKLLS